MSNQKALDCITQGYESILEGFSQLGYDIKDDNFIGTAARSARGLTQMVKNKVEVADQVDAMLTKTFPAKYKEMVISKHNAAFGLCPHHLLPVIYRISLAYIPVGHVLGLSKLSRIAKLKAQAPILQEDLTHELAVIMHEKLESEGSGVYIEGLHMCMAARGVNAHEARLVTSAVKGVFLEKKATRNEFIKLVTADHPRLV